MLKENDNLEEALRMYVSLFENAQYFEAHEILEEAWHPLRRKNHPLKNLVKGIINAAISFEHIKRDQQEANRKAQKVMASYDRYRVLATPQIEHGVLFCKICTIVDVEKEKYPKVF